MYRPNLNAKSEHIFVILRVDGPFEGAKDPEQVTATKAFWSEQEAEAEVARLNRTNADKGCVYFWRLARLKREEQADAAAKEPRT